MANDEQSPIAQFLEATNKTREDLLDQLKALAPGAVMLFLAECDFWRNKSAESGDSKTTDTDNEILPDDHPDNDEGEYDREEDAR